MATDLLPPNATRLERALSIGVARAGDIAFDPVALWNPATCPIDLLPWLAWGLSIDRWEASWSNAEKRAAVAGAIEAQRMKGTRASVETVLSSFDDLLQLVEWWQATPRAAPHTFEIRLPLVDRDGIAGGARASAATANAIIAEVARTKPARAHFALVQTLELTGLPAPVAAMQATAYRRLDVAVAAPDGIAWADLIQTEDGEPIEDDAGTMIDGTAP